MVAIASVLAAPAGCSSSDTSGPGGAGGSSSSGGGTQVAWHTGMTIGSSVTIPAGVRIWRAGSINDSDKSKRFGADDKVFRLDRTALTDCLHFADDAQEKALLRRGRGYKNLHYLLLMAQRMAATRTEFVVFKKAA